MACVVSENMWHFLDKSNLYCANVKGGAVKVVGGQNTSFWFWLAMWDSWRRQQKFWCDSRPRDWFCCKTRPVVKGRIEEDAQAQGEEEDDEVKSLTEKREEDAGTVSEGVGRSGSCWRLWNLELAEEGYCRSVNLSYRWQATHVVSECSKRTKKSTRRGFNYVGVRSSFTGSLWVIMMMMTTITRRW